VQENYTDYLEVETPLTIWMPRMTEDGFEQENDFTPLLEKSTGGRPTKEFAVTIIFAIKMAMLARTKKGKEARQYFIECKKITKEANKVISPAEQLLANAQLLVDIECKQKRNREPNFENRTIRFNAGRKSTKNMCTMQSEKYTHRINP